MAESRYIIDMSAAEIEARLKKIPEIPEETELHEVVAEKIIEQEYKADSTNALSGVAVSEALKMAINKVLEDIPEINLNDLNNNV